LEYYVYASIADATIPADGEKNCPTHIDAFLLSKENEDTHLQKITLTDGNRILQMAEKVADIFLRESLPHGDPNAATADELTLRDRYLYELYALLVQPFQTELDRTATLYVAPDQTLCLIPFEILKTSPTGTAILSDTHTITRLDSARDFLFASDSPVGTRRLVIGNPEYDALSRDAPALERRMTIQAGSVQPLPFSEFEALRVSQICQGQCVIGSRAAKSILTSASDCGIIHIATHGFFDTSLEYDAAYASFLLFAGAKAWMQSGQLDPVYGNGIVTADEISRLDLRSTELVVLSACCSGMTDANVTRNLRGLTGGFAAAGVKYVVTQLWHSNDVATSILMGYFYEEYIDRHLLPPEALNRAKERLKETTVSDMNAMGIIQYGIANSNPGTPMRTLFDRLKSRPATARPYANEFYWGGFSCYQCR
jgi:CHAT domain-containing protein